MKCNCFLLLGAALATFFTAVNPAVAQGTLFTYQGQLVNNGLAANGNYDLAFGLFNATNGPG
jgi:hypothetical protein